MKRWIVQTRHGVEQFDNYEYATKFAAQHCGQLFDRDQVSRIDGPFVYLHASRSLG